MIGIKRTLLAGLAVAVSVAGVTSFGGPAEASDLPGSFSGCIAAFALSGSTFQTKVFAANPSINTCQDDTVDLAFPLSITFPTLPSGPQLGGLGCDIVPALCAPVRLEVSFRLVKAQTRSATGTFGESNALADTYIQQIVVKVNQIIVAEANGAQSHAAATNLGFEGSCRPALDPDANYSYIAGLSVLGVKVATGTATRTLSVPGLPGASIVANYRAMKKTATRVSVETAPIVLTLPGQAPVALGASYAEYTCRPIGGG